MAALTPYYIDQTNRDFGHVVGILSLSEAIHVYSEICGQTSKPRMRRIERLSAQRWRVLLNVTFECLHTNMLINRIENNGLHGEHAHPGFQWPYNLWLGRCRI